MYILYNDKQEISNLDLNVWEFSKDSINKGSTGRRQFIHNPRHPAYFACEKTRDLQTHYIMDIERINHPNHSSRFGYARCPNGYCFGHMPGKYNNSFACQIDPEPEDMAPDRFYTTQKMTPFKVDSQATVDYEIWKNYDPNM